MTNNRWFWIAVVGWVLAVLALGAALTTRHGSATVSPVADEAAARKALERYGNIVAAQPVGSGFTAWTVEKGGARVVLYTNPDASLLMSGVVWDARTGENLSEKLASTPPSLPGALPGNALPTPGAASGGGPAGAAMDGEFKGELPESIKTVASLEGVTEGEGGPADTVYIIVDPRCPYCRQTYNMTRDYVKAGRTIKWIPTIALGDATNGLPLAAAILQSKEPDAVERILGKHERITSAPTKETEEALERNLSFMLAAFEQNSELGQAGVPVAFYLDHRTGQPRMMTGVSENVVLRDIFGTP